MKETPSDAEELSRQCVEGAGAGGGAGLSPDLAFWPQDLGILGGSAKVSLRRKIGSLTCDLLT